MRSRVSHTEVIAQERDLPRAGDSDFKVAHRIDVITRAVVGPTQRVGKGRLLRIAKTLGEFECPLMTGFIVTMIKNQCSQVIHDDRIVRIRLH